MRGRARSPTVSPRATATATCCSRRRRFPARRCTELLAAEGLACDVASGGELALALRGGFDPGRIYMHGNAKSEAELREALAAGVGHIVLDSFDDFDRLERIAGELGVVQEVLIRVNPDVAGDTHDAISTGQADSKFGFDLADAVRAIERATDTPHLRLVGAALPHRLAAARARAVPPRGPGDRGLGDVRGLQPRRRARRRVHSRSGTPVDRRLRRRDRRRRARRARRRRAAADRARTRARREFDRDAVHRADREAQRLDLGCGRRRHVRQPAADAVRLRVRGGDRRPDARRRRPCAATSPASTASRAT